MTESISSTSTTSECMIGPLCEELGITKPVVQKFCDDDGFSFEVRRHHPLHLCLKGLVIELWQHLSTVSLDDNSTKSKALILGRVLYAFFGEGNEQVLFDNDLLVDKIYVLMRRKRTCPKFEPKRKQTKNKKTTLAELKKQVFKFCEGGMGMTEEGHILEEEREKIAARRDRQEIKKLKLQNHHLKRKLDLYVEKEQKEGGPFTDDEERKFAIEIAKECQKTIKNLKLELGKYKVKHQCHQKNIRVLKQCSQRRKDAVLRWGELNQKLQRDVQVLRTKLDKKLHLGQKCKRLQSRLAKQREDIANFKKANRQLNLRLERCHAALCTERMKGAARLSEIELLSNFRIQSTLQYAQDKIRQNKGSSSVLAQKLRKRARGLKKNLKAQGVKLKSVRGEVRTLKKLVSSLDYERAELAENMDSKIEERLQAFLKSQEVVTFQGGMYVDAVRALYMDLMGMNVGSRNCESVVRCVMSKLARNVKLGRLPKATFAKTMIIEGRALAQQQIVDKMLSPVGESITLCTDGTTKWGYKYGAFDVVLEDGTSLTIGLRDMAGGGAEETMQTLEDILEDCTNIRGSGVECFNSLIARIKNTMSDRHSAEKKGNELLKQFRDRVLPNVVENWGDLSETERSSVSRMNNFFCGLHFIVGLANQASEVLKLYEKEELFGHSVGSATLPGMFVKGVEAGTVKLVRLVCKTVQARACEKSGTGPVDFLTFLNVTGSEKRVDLVPFKGNRFNVLFKNGGVIYYLYDELCQFFESVKDGNFLMKVVLADLKVKSFKAGVRALGLVNKAVTSPLWREMNGVEENGERVHILDMNEKYHEFVKKMRSWSKNATPVLKGEFLYEGSIMDEVYKCLLAESDTGPLCKKILELMCASFAKLGERMLCDHLEGGKFWNVTNDVRGETMSVPTTNVGVERDFGMLDRLMREKPNASTLALEGLIMWQENKTGMWRDDLSEEVRARYMRIARESMHEQRRMYFERRKAIKEVRARRWAEQHERAVAKEDRERERMVSLSNDLKQVGGLWSSMSELEERMNALSDEREKCDALKVQLKYWKWVLKARNTDGMLNLSVAGKPKRFNELLKSVKEVIQQQSLSLQGSLPSEVSVSERVDVEGESESTLSLAKKGTPSGTGGLGALRVVPSSHNQKPLADVKNLVGRVVKHHFSEGDLNLWHMGVVTKKLGRKLYIRYDNDRDDSGRCFDSETILEDYATGVLYEIADFGQVTAVGRRVKHMWLDEDTDDEDWWCGRVLNVNENEVVIEYDEVYVDDEDESDDYDDERVTFPLEEIQEAYHSRGLLFI